MDEGLKLRDWLERNLNEKLTYVRRENFRNFLRHGQKFLNCFENVLSVVLRRSAECFFLPSLSRILRKSFLVFPTKQWPTRQGRNLRIMIHVFSSKFCVKNDECNENFKKKLLSEILTFFVSVNSNVPLSKKSKLNMSQITR